MKTAIKRAAAQGTSRQAKKGKSSLSQKTRLRNVPRNLTTVNLGVGFPKRLCLTQKYVAFPSITSTLGVLGSYRFSCNGLFDPDITSTGHQPLYFANLSAIYDHYTVIGSKITVRFVPLSDTQGPAAAAIFVNDDTTLSVTNVGNAMEQSSGTTAVLLPVGQSVPLVITKTWSAKKTFGGSILGNDNLQGTVAANPTEQSYYEIIYQDLNTAQTSTVKCIVELQYTAVWDELKDLAQQ